MAASIWTWAVGQVLQGMLIPGRPVMGFALQVELHLDDPVEHPEGFGIAAELRQADGLGQVGVSVFGGLGKGLVADKPGTARIPRSEK